MNLRLQELEAETQYASDRLRLYRARAYGPRVTSPRRLHDLEQRWKLADSRLRRAQQASRVHRAQEAAASTGSRS